MDKIYIHSSTGSYSPKRNINKLPNKAKPVQNCVNKKRESSANGLKVSDAEICIFVPKILHKGNSIWGIFVVLI